MHMSEKDTSQCEQTLQPCSQSANEALDAELETELIHVPRSLLENTDSNGMESQRGQGFKKQSWSA